MKTESQEREKSVLGPSGGFRWMIVLALLLVARMGMATPAVAEKRVTLSVKDVSLETFFVELKKASGYVVVFNHADIDATRKITVEARNEPLARLLDRVLPPCNLAYKLVEDNIVISRRKPARQEKPSQTRVLSGQVVDSFHAPLPGVSVMFKGTHTGIKTDGFGRFRLVMPEGKSTLVFSFIGMEPKEVAYTGQDSVRVVLDEALNAIDEVTVVSTGYQNVNRRDMVGSYSMVKADDIKIAGYSNIADCDQKQYAGGDESEDNHSRHGYAGQYRPAVCC